MTKQLSTYESPEMEELLIATLHALAQSVTDPDGEGEDFSWGSFGQ